MNVRTVPGGSKIVDTLRNGTAVIILDTKTQWAYIGLLPEDDEAAKGDKAVVPTGWAYREYLNCTASRSKSGPDDWLVVKDLTANTCAVLTTKPNNENLVIITSFKAYVTGGKAMKDMIAKECGCDTGCSWKLPR